MAAALAATTIRVAFLLYPSIASLDVYGPLQVLNLVSMNHSMELSLLSTDLKPISMDRTIMDGVASGIASDSPSPYFSQFIQPTHTFADPPEVDIIFVPGGYGARNETLTQPTVDWLTEHYDDPEVDYVMGICTGGALLARTNTILHGKNVTTNKSAFEWVKSLETSGTANFIPRARWVVDGNLWTSSGVSAGTDMTLAWVTEVYGQAETTRVVNLMEWNQLGEHDDPFADIWGVA